MQENARGRATCTRKYWTFLKKYFQMHTYKFHTPLYLTFLFVFLQVHVKDTATQSISIISLPVHGNFLSQIHSSKVKRSKIKQSPYTSSLGIPQPLLCCVSHKVSFTQTRQKVFIDPITFSHPISHFVWVFFSFR